MPRCFVFAFGGTGSRVLEKLTFLMASGSAYDDQSGYPNVEMPLGDWDIVPIIIDLDQHNGNMNSCTELLEEYHHIHHAIQDVKQDKLQHKFFRYKLKKLKDINSATKSQDFNMNIQNVGKHTLSDSIGFQYLSIEEDLFGTDQLVNLLYGQDELNMPLNKGFKGNPNIGTVIFGQLKNNPDFRTFLNTVSSEDRIFIIGSIFGGTGASGLPWLLKTLRNPVNINKNKTQILQEIKIGALIVTPYFRLQPDKASEIDSDSFITKTKAGLKYYEHNVQEANAMYFIGDRLEEGDLYPNEEGGKEQKNPPHPSELFGALSFFHFMTKTNAELPARETKHFRYGVKVDAQQKKIYFRHFENNTPSSRWLKLPLTMLYLSSIVFKKVMPTLHAPEPYIKIKIIEKKGNIFSGTKVDESFKETEFYKKLSSFFGRFLTLLQDLEEREKSNHHLFTPFMTNPQTGTKGIDRGDATPVNDLILQNPIGQSKTKGRFNGTKYKVGETDIVQVNVERVPIKYVHLIDALMLPVYNINHDFEGDNFKQIRLIELLYRGVYGFLLKHKHEFVMTEIDET